MSEEMLKFTKIWFLVAGFVQLSFAIAFFFLYDWFFLGIQHWPFDDQGLALLFGGAVLSLSVMDFLVFFKAKWESVKIPLITILVFCFTGFGLMLYIQFGLEGVHAWNWMNTSAYLIMGIGFVVALFRELKARKVE
jgi:hypothetical protein